MLITKRFIVTALRPAQLRIYLESRGVYETELEYINDMLTKLLECDGDSYYFYTFWVGVDKQTQEIVGEITLKGEPVNGEVEIGYTSFRPGQGVMTEMVEAVKFWAEANDLKLMAIATNPASEKVLMKNGFINTSDNIFKSS